jgi:hypothetical protein
MRLARHTLLGIAAAFALAACSVPDLHTAQDYAAAAALGDPDGSLTTIVGPSTAVVQMRSSVRFPQGDVASGVHSVLMYDGPANAPGTCRFQIGYEARNSSTIVKEDPVTEPCDGKRPARFRIAGNDVAFTGHLVQTTYKGTPVTLFEISGHAVPASIRVVY